MVKRAAWILVAVSLASTGCRASSPAGPSALLDGHWSGAIVDSVAGTGTAALSMDQTGPGVSGTWSATFPDAAFNRRGSIGGTMRGSEISLFLSPETPLTCSSAITLSGTLGFTGTADGDHLVGTYVVLTCDGATSGSLDLRKDD